VAVTLYPMPVPQEKTGGEEDEEVPQRKEEDGVSS
jgi:hypothetical protein